ncbi:MAG: S46 family peptidase [Planctomycetaceae bacterium]|jgi:hypothetical protein|nr:S46 family peptidase [Planctomycetaceae bacterium]
MKLSISKLTCATLFAALVFISFTNARADEGMWLFEAPPKQQVKERYNFDMTDSWLEHLRLSSVRFGRGGSASFVSANGLIMTNHHVGAGYLQMHSTPENDMLANGFYAKTLADELPCKGLECITLYEVVDVTEQLAAATKGLAADDAAKVRKTKIAEIEKENADKKNLHCEVVTLFQGGKYHLYCYKKYTDVRLVWAPEQNIASFGGDPDNYEYPRYCVDCSLFRAYENGKPAVVKHYLKWATGGVTDGELVFVAGHPGTTNRAYTKEHLIYLRDVHFPERLERMYRREVIYSVFANRNLENARRVGHDLDVVQNYRKRAIGQIDGLQTPSLWNGKITAASVASTRPEAIIAKACERSAPIYKPHIYYEGGEAFNSQTFRFARQILRLADELEKPNANRLKEYRDSGIDFVKQTLLNEAPIYEDVEVLKLTDSLTMLEEYVYGELILDANKKLNDKPLGELIPPELQKESPKELAIRLVRGSKLRDVAVRKALIDGGKKAVDASTDPMLLFAKAVDERSRKLREIYENEYDSPTTAAYAELAKERFEQLGTNVYPDATFTLRLSYGAVKGYKEDDGTQVKPVTNIAGMFERAETMKYREPFNPPKSWLDNKSKLNQNCAFNLVSTNDIIGGNSGSPMVNAKGEVVGLVFDGNIYSLSNNFVYSETQSRCVSVHVDVILESLRKIYNAERIVEELVK